jgi:hypothetical protein
MHCAVNCHIVQLFVSFCCKEFEIGTCEGLLDRDSDASVLRDEIGDHRCHISEVAYLEPDIANEE